MSGVFNILNLIFLLYSAVVGTSYLVLGVLSMMEISRYKRKNSFVDYRQLLVNENVPSVAVIAPAYNESATIVENVKSLLSLQYPRLEIVIVNDGSKDDTLQKVIDKYNLVPVNYLFKETLKAKPVRGIYRSLNPAYSRILVVDKVNGGKADALNVGLNLVQADLVTCIDVDCMLAEDSLLKLVKPFLEKGKGKLIACGGAIKIANSGKIVSGKLIEAKVPQQFLAKIQVLEYIRAFLMGRMGWSRINGLLLISGAFGMFDRRIALEAGGYDPSTVGEDMELVVRMRRVMMDRKEKHRVSFIPDPLCWTEVPESLKILGSQRNRWTRGTIETLWLHRRMFFNPRFGRVGLLSYSYWFFFEWLAPLIEFFGLFYFLTLMVFYDVYWLYFISLLAGVYFFAIMNSCLALLTEEWAYTQYPGKRDGLKLLFISLIEPVIFHPFVVWSAVKGNWFKLFKKNLKWGQMTRKGFNTPAAK